MNPSVTAIATITARNTAGPTAEDEDVRQAIADWLDDCSEIYTEDENGDECTYEINVKIVELAP